MSVRGDIAFPVDASARLSVACAVAGLLAELGVAELRVTDPRHCAIAAIRARECNLPEMLSTSAPGTMLSTLPDQPSVAMLIDESHLRFVVDEQFGPEFMRLASSCGSDAHP